MRILAVAFALAGAAAAQDGSVIELDGEALSVAIKQPRAAQIGRRFIVPIARRRSTPRRRRAHKTADAVPTSSFRDRPAAGYRR